MNMQRKKLSELTITDDFMFGEVMRNKKLAKGLIERVLGDRVGKISRVVPQKVMKSAYDSRGVRFDVYAEAKNGRIYDVEIQTLPHKDLAKRTRYYHDVIDSYITKPGVLFSELKPCYVIFVCTFDPFNRGNYLYSFEMKSDDEPPVLMGDESYTVFLNITGSNGKISMDLDRLVAYFRDGKSNDEFTRSLDNSVQMIRNDPAKEAEYMTMLCKLDEERAAGREEGRAAGREEGLEEGQAKERIRSAKSFVKTALLNNCSEDMILNMLSSMYDWSIEEAKEFYQKSKLDVD